MSSHFIKWLKTNKVQEIKRRGIEKPKRTTARPNRKSPHIKAQKKKALDSSLPMCQNTCGRRTRGGRAETTFSSPISKLLPEFLTGDLPETHRNKMLKTRTSRQNERQNQRS